MLNKTKQKYTSAEFELLKNILTTTTILSFGAYCIPSIYNSIKKMPESSLGTKFNREKYDKYDDEAYTLGMTFGLTGFATQSYLYSQNPEFLAIPILTNIFSGIYEFRKTMNQKKLENKLDLY